MQTESTAKNILDRVERWLLEPLREAAGSPGRHFHIFVLVSVVIDNLANFRYQSVFPEGDDGCVGMRYRTFIEQYFPPAYKPHAALLYSGYRCKLVHGFQLRGIDIQQEDRHRHLHLVPLPTGKLCLHSKELVMDLHFAYDRLKAQLLGPTVDPEAVAAFEKGKFKKWEHTEPVV